MTFHIDEYFKNFYFFLNYVSRSVQVSADALRSQRNWSQTQAFWKSRIHSTMEPSFPSWFCSIFSVCSMYNMLVCVSVCIHAHTWRSQSRTPGTEFLLELESSPQWPDWLVDWGNSGHLQTCLPLYVAGDLH